MQAREWMLTVAVILVPLCIAVVVTLWSLEQARYRPKKRRGSGARGQGSNGVASEAAGDAGSHGGVESA